MGWGPLRTGCLWGSFGPQWKNKQDSEADFMRNFIICTPQHVSLGLLNQGAEETSRKVREFSPPPRFNLRTFQLVASSFTDWVVPICYYLLRAMHKFDVRRIISETPHKWRYTCWQHKLHLQLKEFLTYANTDSEFWSSVCTISHTLIVDFHPAISFSLWDVCTVCEFPNHDQSSWHPQRFQKRSQ